MNKSDLDCIISNANMIVDGYAFTQSDNKVKVLNLNKPDHSSVMSLEGEILETSMDDIELTLVCEIYSKNKEFMEE